MTEVFDGDALPRDTPPNPTVEKFELGHGVPTGALMSAGIALFVEGKLWRAIRGGWRGQDGRAGRPRDSLGVMDFAAGRGTLECSCVGSVLRRS